MKNDISDERIEILLSTVTYCSWAVYFTLIWFFRFVPSVDYPDWLLQANILAHYNDVSYDFKTWYEAIWAPVPNGGFVLPVAALAKFLPIEMAGKAALSCYIVGFPLSVRYFFRSVGNYSPLWMLSILLLFNVSFVYGNLSFLLSMCLLLGLIGYAERAKVKLKTSTAVIILIGALMLFVAHAVAAIVFLCYAIVQTSEKTSSSKSKRILGACIALTIILGILYFYLRPSEKMITGFEYGVDIRYRLLYLAKSFVAGWAFPPYEFSLLRTLSTLSLLATVITITMLSMLQLLRRFTSSSAVRFVVILALLTPLAPKSIAGSAEMLQRLTLISFLVLMAFFEIPSPLRKMFTSFVIILTCLITVVRIQDYRQSSLLISRRFDCISQALQRLQGVLTLDDDLGQFRIPFYHFLPKGFHFIFQSNYHLLQGGYNPLTFRTGYVIPRDDFLFTLATLHEQQTTQTLLLLRGDMIPKTISHIILDGSRTWVEQMTKNMQVHFVEIASREIAPGIQTVVLQRK